MGGTDAAVADEIPMYATPVQEVPMRGTVAVVGPMDVDDYPRSPYRHECRIIGGLA
jgi:hypothetical protein